MLANVPEQQTEDSVSEDDIGDELKASLIDNEAESAPAQVTKLSCSQPANLHNSTCCSDDLSLNHHVSIAQCKVPDRVTICSILRLCEVSTEAQ